MPKPIARRVAWTFAAAEILLAALTPFAKADYSVPWTLPTMLILLPVAVYAHRWAKRTDIYRTRLPTEGAIMERLNGRWYGVVFWGLPFAEWKWDRVREHENFVPILVLAAVILVSPLVYGLFYPVDAFLIGLSLALAGSLTLIQAISAARTEFAAVWLD